ncbi:hypothetical protein MKW98_025533 [Papaver atlanticum]|uniref:Flavin-containing monooxygenase n=1 Tax=Papaver atlanticum TaxID=357466 RepID=A0AAD4XCV5_9MAGN|nr:hypothetical protein MKW98_025533 [Papaver atlanticum]
MFDAIVRRSFSKSSSEKFTETTTARGLEGTYHLNLPTANNQVGALTLSKETCEVQDWNNHTLRNWLDQRFIAMHFCYSLKLVHTKICQLNFFRYKYYFPFLEINNIVTVDDSCVGPLYKHIFPPMLAPTLSFIGIPFWALPFPIFEMESKWVAGVLSGRCSLPSEQQIIKDVEAFYLELEAAAVPKRYTHRLAEKQCQLFDEENYVSHS